MLGFWSCIFYSRSAGLTEPDTTLLMLDCPDSLGSEIKVSNLANFASERQYQRMGGTAVRQAATN